VAADPLPPPQRSLLAVPATNARFLEKAAQSAADAVFIDLEDAVVRELKVEARGKAIAAINGLDWGRRIVSVRVNALDTEWGCRDVIELAEACPRLDRILLPKCETPGDVHAVSAMLGATPVRIAALVETAKGVVNVEAIAAAGERLAAIVFGSGDYSLDLGVVRKTLSNEPWGYALARIGNACRAFGLAAIDGPFSDIADVAGLRADALRAAALGFEGKMAIHPSQIDVANEVFSPSAEQVAWAREVLDAMTAAGVQGRGAVRDKQGAMIDLVHIKIARKILERAQRTATRR
jgi:malyl-CoA/(S)-citramalyl-CoA lyase